ncbi:hypothetical protein ABB55_20710 [Prosthecomicrobium hirschii]|uniref:HTH araC/xylS-type domain-containing protein n=1 Tax=Prosthecodimorpha hirschii TaxID=665126 RepID=A0A0P6WCK6_9HYPH|nr:helix-turn-helix domain-containing protein [Prosthecomicrobium hirschii]KPL54332.1 hypothetical protein ABB55_20710 [Prosthecomicrobium hirschii]
MGVPISNPAHGSETGPIAAVPAGVERRETRSTDIDEHAAALSGWDQCYTQLDAGPFRGLLTQVGLPGITLFAETTNLKLRQDVAPPPNSFVLGFPLPSSAPGLFHGCPAAEGTALTLRHGEAHEFICHERMHLSAVVLELDRCPSWGLDADDFSRARMPPIVGGPAAQALGAWVMGLVGDLAAAGPMIADETALASLPALIAGRCLSLFATEERPAADLSPSQRYRIVAEARALVEAAETEPPPLTVLARRLGVSVRTLEYCFSETLGLSPSTYIRNVRLHGARRDLKAAAGTDATVADIAMAWGFWHLGRFSAFYRDMFGESPSETLRKRGARA